MRSLNTVFLLGRLGKDAETKHTFDGPPVTNFSIATDRRVKRGEEWVNETDWHNIVAWRMEGVAPYLTKGKAVLVEGRLRTRSYDKDGQKRYVTEVVAEEVILLGDGGAAGGEKPANDRPASVPRSCKQSEQSARAPESQGIVDDDVPF